MMKLMSGEWPRRFMSVAELVATWSKDRSTQVGAVIVGPGLDIRSTGYNGFPRGIDDDVEERHERPAKYLWTSHAEENAVLNATIGHSQIRGCVLFCTCEPCARCSRVIVQAGIAGVVYVAGTEGFQERFAEELAVSRTMLREGNVARVEMKLGDTWSLHQMGRHNLWTGERDARR